MKRITALMSIFSLLLLSPISAAQAQAETEPLYTLAARFGMKMGAPLSYHQLLDTKYLSLVRSHFNSVTATNEMKAYSLLDEWASRRSADGMPVMNYKKADDMVAWARKNGIGVRGHVLVWDAYMLDWFFHEEYDVSKPYASRDTIRARTESYITQVITHFENKFPGTVYCWDVVNEAVGDQASEYKPTDPRHLRTKRSGKDNLFQKYMGNDYVERSFLYARNAVEALNADIRLYYNDYNAFFPDKATAIRILARNINSFSKDADGNPRKLLDGIGMQGYIGGYGTQDGCLQESHLDMIKKAIQSYEGLGLEVQITEMAVRNYDPAQKDRHAAYYGKLFEMLAGLAKDGTGPLKAVSIWGLTDCPNEPKNSYVYKMNSPYGGLVDEKLDYKDAFRKVYQALDQHP